jgi:hypothetical protein
MKIKEAIDILQDYYDSQMSFNEIIGEKEDEFTEALGIAVCALKTKDGKKPINIKLFDNKIEKAQCPSCGYNFPDIGGICESCFECEQPEYCCECGQKIDWTGLKK